MSITNRLKFWRTSAAKTVGVTAALAVFGSVLVASPASAVSDNIGVDYWVNDADSATVCVYLYGADTLAQYPDGNGGFTYTDVTEALTIDTENTGELAEATITYVGANTGCGDWEYSITDIYVGDWNEINFRFDAWITNNGNDVWAEGSTIYHDVYQDYVDAPDYVYYVDTDYVSENSQSEVGLAWQNDGIQDERHAAFYCLDNDYYQNTWVDDNNEEANDYIERSETVVGDPIVYVYDLTAGEMVADNVGTAEDITIYDVYEDDEWNFQHCDGDDREFWIEGLELGHTYEFQAQYEVEHYMYFDDGDSDWSDTTYVYTLGFDRSVNFTPLDIRQNLVGVLPGDNDGRDGENEYWEDSEYLNGMSGWYWNYFVTGDADQFDQEQYTNVDVILPEIQGYISGDYSELDALTAGDVDSKWYVEDEWSANDEDSYDYYDADYTVYDGNGWGWDWTYTTACDVNGSDVNSYDENFSDACEYEYETWYGDRGNYEVHDGGRWGHLRNFEGQAFVTVANWENDSYDWVNDVYQDEEDVLEGLSNSYSSVFDWNFEPDYVRATGTDSLQLSLATGTGYDYDCGNGDIEESVNVGDSNATFHIRLLPNYGQDADYDAEDGYYENGAQSGIDNYLGNESFPETRLWAIDYHFAPGEYQYNGYDVWDCGNSDRSIVVFDLESYDQDENGTLDPWETLEPGTTYSVEVMATFDRLESDNDDREWGDGGYDFVSFGSYRNSFATTYLESHVDVLGENTAKFEINLQDSHYTDRHNMDQAGYLAWTECEDWEEGIDCNQYVSSTESNQQFNIADINRVSVSSDADVEFIDGDKHLVFTRSDLSADTSYQVVFGLDYYPTDSALDDTTQSSRRLEVEDTLDGSNCDYYGFYEQGEYAEYGTDCYNSTTENDFYRTDVTQFRTFGAPELDAVTTVDNDAAQDGTDTNTTITLEFSENVMAGSGLIQVIRASDDKVVQTLRPSASQNVAIDGGVVTITLGKNLDYSTDYYVYVGAGAFHNEDGVHFAGNDNDVTVFTTEDKPEEIGSVDVQLLADFKRTISVNLKKSVAFETVQVWWHEHHTAKLFYAGSITLDENGDGDFTRVLPRLGTFDNVVITLGRHTVASQIVATS